MQAGSGRDAGARVRVDRLVNVEATYEGWKRVQDRLVFRLPQLSPEDLATSGAGEGWPVWAIAAHLAGTRVYWLSTVCGEPGAETTPFPDPANDGWEDHLDQPRTAEELLGAVVSSGAIVSRCLETWNPGSLATTASRTRNGRVEHHTRASILTRIVMHDSFHAGEISLLLGGRGVPSLDPWEPVPSEVR